MQGYVEANNLLASPGQQQWAFRCFLKLVKELYNFTMVSVEARETGVQGHPPLHSALEVSPTEALPGRLVLFPQWNHEATMPIAKGQPDLQAKKASFVTVVRKLPLCSLCFENFCG